MSKITELRNKVSDNIDNLSILEILMIINNEDSTISDNIKTHLMEIEKIIKDVVNSFNKNGRLFYIGCGSSGRIGVLDASECPPTFSVPDNMVQGIIAGGNKALHTSIEGAEDDYKKGFNILEKKKLSHRDTVIGISANGNAQFVLGALKYAHQISASTSLITFNQCDKRDYIKNILSIIVGPEVIAGSTRMKAGTATKLVLNMISTVSMIKINKTYGNYMVDLKISNNKLLDRGTRIISEITGLDYDNSQLLLKKANKNVKTAIVMELMNLSYQDANDKILSNNGKLSNVLR